MNETSILICVTKYEQLSYFIKVFKETQKFNYKIWGI